MTATLTDTLEIRFHVYTDSNDIDYILPAERDLAREEQQVVEILEAKLRSDDPLLDDTVKRTLQHCVDSIKFILHTKSKQRADLLPYSIEHVYRFTRPTPTQQIEAEEAARLWDATTGTAVVDEVKKLRCIVRQCLQIPTEQFMNLSPVVGRYIECCVSNYLGNVTPHYPPMRYRSQGWAGR